MSIELSTTTSPATQPGLSLFIQASRYFQQDVDHAIAAATIAVRVLGWRTILLEGDN